MSDSPVLLLVQADPILDDGDRRAIMSKTLSGILAYCERWPGAVVVSAPIRRVGRGEIGALHADVDKPDLPFTVLTGLAPEAAARHCSPSVVLALHSPQNYALLDWDAARTVFTFENGARQRLRIETMQASGTVSRARILVGHARRFRGFHRSLRMAAGVQCNGYAAWEAAQGIARSGVLFFDHRISEQVMRDGSGTRPAIPGSLRLGFSGRHIPIKGPHDALDMLAALREEGADVSMTVFGDGPLRRELEARAVDRASFTGDIDFEAEWVPRVRRSIDLMVLPYPQGDPAGTYMESFALGVPVLGYDNDAYAPLVRRHGVGWSVPVRDTKGLIEEGRRLLSAPGEVGNRASGALAFARRHSMEHEFDIRVQHLREVAQI